MDVAVGNPGGGLMRVEARAFSILLSSTSITVKGRTWKMSVPFLRSDVSNAMHEVNILNDPVQISQQENNNNLNNRLLAKRCLFGPANPIEVTKLLDENICVERERFKEKFGVDINAIEKKIDNKKALKRLVIKVDHDLKKKNELRGVLKPLNKQFKITGKLMNLFVFY